MQRIVFFSVLIMFIQFNVVGQTQKDSRTQVFPSGNKIEHTGNNRSSSCSETSEGTIPLIDCADVGTSSYNTNSLTSTVNSSVLASDAASPNPSCWDGTEYAGNWSVYDLSSGGTSLMVEVESFFDGGFCDVFWLTFYQGPDCSSLTEVGLMPY